MARGSATLVAIVLSLFAGAARADEKSDESRAAALFRAATAAYASRDFVAAANTFEDAHKLVPRAQTIYNAGLAWSAAKVSVRAANAFQSALDVGGLELAQDNDARERLNALARTLGRIRVVGPSSGRASIDGAELRPLPLAAYVEPGAHEVELVADDGWRSSRSIAVAAGDDKEIAFELPKVEPRPPAPAEIATQGAGAPPLEDRAFSPWSLVPGGIAVAAGAAALILGIRALEARSAFDASQHMDRAAHDRAQDLRLWSNISAVAALASGGVGVLVLTVF
jgi:tetratricopeptide (TPR) repeat protein